MHISERGLKLIEEFEGGRSADGLFHAYLDTVAQPPIWTIGFGQTHNVHQGMTWTLRQALDDLARTLAQDGYESAINALGVDLGQDQFDALCSFVYNVGPGGVAASTTVGRELRARNWQAAADALLEWDRAGGQVIPGLLRRRQAERTLFLTHSPPPDPHGYLKLDSTIRHLDGRLMSERQTCIEYDRERRHWLHWPGRLKRLRQNCGLLADRLESVRQSQGGHWRDDQLERHNQLRRRQAGKRVVG